MKQIESKNMNNEINMDLIRYSIRSNQKHQHLREKYILESIEVKFDAIIEQLPNLDKDKLKENLAMLKNKFEEAEKELIKEDNNNLGKILSILTSIGEN